MKILALEQEVLNKASADFEPYLTRFWQRKLDSSIHWTRFNQPTTLCSLDYSGLFDGLPLSL